MTTRGLSEAPTVISHVGALVILGICGVLLTAGGTLAEARSHGCIRADIDQSVRLPHGEVLEPGTLRLCQGTLSPVTHLHRTYMNGRPVGMLLSRELSSEAANVDEPVILFDRADDGRLELVGYILPHGSSDGTVFWFVPYGPGQIPRVRVSEVQVLLAAQLD